MKRSELKQVLKPLIKECIKEAIFEEGVLSNIISEVVQGLSNKTLVESNQHIAQTAQQNADKQQDEERVRQKLQETKKRMLDAIGNDSYNGVDLFEGTTSTGQESKQGDPMAGIDPRDSGVDISKLFGGTSKNWSHLIK